MAGLNGLLGIARDALNAQSFGLSLTSQNVSNVNTPGYVRRDAMLETVGAPGVPQGGVRARGTRRAADQLVERRLYQSNSFSSAAKDRDAALSQVESLMNDEAGTGIRSEIQALFSSFSTLSANPGDAATRGVVLARARDLASRFRDTAAGFSQLRDDLTSRAQGDASEANDLLAQIAALNKDIALAEAGGDVAADLRDQQGELVRKLSERVEVNALHGSDGLVVLSGGVALVEGKHHASLSTALDGNGMLEINAVRPTGVSINIASKLDGGSLAGIREARDVELVDLAESLDQLAYDLATAVNVQHEAGVGLDGVGGRALFDVSAPPGSAHSLTVSGAVAGNPDAVAAATTAGSLPGGSDNAVALAGLAQSTVASGNTRTLVEAYGDLVGRVGASRASAAREVEVRDAMQDQLFALRESISGVSLDEEMVSLTRYQRGYEAAAKLVSTVDGLLEQLIRQV